jgi:hypothetical protein
MDGSTISSKLPWCLLMLKFTEIWRERYFPNAFRATLNMCVCVCVCVCS